MTGITAHVLDTSRGKPAAALSISLARAEADGTYTHLCTQVTDANGRVADLTAASLQAGTYRLSFDTGAYFIRQGQQAFYPRVDVVFEVLDAGEHYHIPLLISPFGYSTYRGS